MYLTNDLIASFGRQMCLEEKSQATQEKYLRDVTSFSVFLQQKQLTKEQVIAWKASLLHSGYAKRSVNSMIASVNHLLEFLQLPEYKVKSLRIQRKVYSAVEQELTKEEYLRLLSACKQDLQLHLVMQSICATGIRVSELQHFTVEAVSRGEVVIECKGKTRTVLLPGKLKKMLLQYAGRQDISSGVLFRGKTGKPLDRSYIWRRMKQLCQAANVAPGKVFPHNLRKLFARTFYKAEKDIAKLADVLGHSNVNTTRIYLISTGFEHRRIMDHLHLVI